MTSPSRLGKRILSALVAAVALAASPAFGDIIPTGDVSPANTSTWTASTTAYIGKTTSGTVSVTPGSQLQSAYAYLGYTSSAAGTVTITGAGSGWKDDYLYCGYSGTGVVTILDGGTVSSAISYLGYNSGSTGTVMVSGAGSGWKDNYLYVGNSGTGLVTILNGGTVSSANGYLGYNSGSTGTVMVSGAGSGWNTQTLYVGNSGTGTLNISEGGSVSNGGDLYVGSGAGSSGTAAVDGTGSMLSVGSLIVGGSGTGAVNVVNGATLTTTLARVRGGGTATINGRGSTWIVGIGILYVGDSRTSTLTITHGGSVSAPGGYLGFDAGAVGNVTVDGSGSNWSCNGYLYVGYFGAATMQITNGAICSSYGGELGHASGGAGVVTVDGNGSQWNCVELYVGNSGTGTLNITHGGMVNVGAAVYIDGQGISAGSVGFGTNGGTLTAQSLFGASTQLTGVGTVNTRGLVSDGELVLDATHGLNQTLAWVSAQTNVTVHLDLTGGSGAAGALGAGYRGVGSLMIKDRVVVTSADGVVGYQPGSAGVVTVDGSGSTWICNGALSVGWSGAGTLIISNGGMVTVKKTTQLAVNATSTGTVIFGDNGGILTTQSFYGAPAQVTGVGTINTRGLISDGQVMFDASHGLSQTVMWTSAQAQVAVHLDLTGNTGAVGALGAGYLDAGTLTIREGVAVTSGSGILGYNAGSTGTATVDSGATWNCLGMLVGNSGSGKLAISHGGKVNSSTGFLGYNSGSAGIVTIDGSGSIWSCSGGFYVGEYGSGILNISNGGKLSNAGASMGAYGKSTAMVRVDGAGSSWTSSGQLEMSSYHATTLTISNGGAVTAAGVWIGQPSLVAISVGDGSSLSAGSQTLVWSGIIRLTAVPSATAGIYTPITAGSWTGSGPVQALGGSWNNTTHTFTVTAAATGNAGISTAFNQALSQRVVITDPASANVVQAAFPSTIGTSMLSFTASLLTDQQSALLTSTLPANTFELAGWTFSASPYTAGTPVFLSLQIGPNLDPGTLALYHFDGTAWSPYAASDLSYDGTYANFTVTSFSGYAVTTTIPEPAALVLLALGGIPLVLRRRWGTCRRNCSDRTTA